MENITLPQTILEQLYNISYFSILWKAKNYSYVKKGDVLGVVSYTVKEEKKILFFTQKAFVEKKYQIIAPNEGYLYIDFFHLHYWIGIEFRWGRLYWDEDTLSYDPQLVYNLNKEDEENDIDYLKGTPQASLFNSPYDLFSFYYNPGHSRLITDPYTKTRKIEWANEKWVQISFGDIINLDFHGDKAYLNFESINKIQKGNCISFLFNNGKTIDYSVTIKPNKHETWADNCTPEAVADFKPNQVEKPGYEVSFALYQEDVDLLLHSSLVSYRITHNGTAKPPDTIEINDLFLDHPFVNEAIHAYMKNRLDTIKKLVPDFQFPRRSIEVASKGYHFDGCYVYLMKDTANGYHKIGISNTPEYRERTLQSEKPTIIMLACKKYPTRKIAESMETALHNAYSQQRLRGEWFHLSDIDVAAIIETLK